MSGKRRKRMRRSKQFYAHQPDVNEMDAEIPGANGLDAGIAIPREFHEARR
jgi:hypothetical protein